MLIYVIRRVALAIVVLFGLLVATFFMIHLVPGDPVEIVLGGHAPPAEIARVRHQLGLDRPLLSQFWLYLSHTFQGHFGTSFTLGAPVGQIIGQRLVPSAELIGYALLISLVIGVPLAIAAALRPNRWTDKTIRMGTTVTFAMPSFWLGLDARTDLRLGARMVSGRRIQQWRGWVLPDADAACIWRSDWR